MDRRTPCVSAWKGRRDLVDGEVLEALDRLDRHVGRLLDLHQCRARRGLAVARRVLDRAQARRITLGLVAPTAVDDLAELLGGQVRARGLQHLQEDVGHPVGEGAAQRDGRSRLDRLEVGLHLLDGLAAELGGQELGAHVAALERGGGVGARLEQARHVGDVVQRLALVPGAAQTGGDADGVREEAVEDDQLGCRAVVRGHHVLHERRVVDLLRGRHVRLGVHDLRTLGAERALDGLETLGGVGGVVADDRHGGALAHLGDDLRGERRVHQIGPGRLDAAVEPEPVGVRCAALAGHEAPADRRDLLGVEEVRRGREEPCAEHRDDGEHLVLLHGLLHQVEVLRAVLVVIGGAQVVDGAPVHATFLVGALEAGLRAEVRAGVATTGAGQRGDALDGDLGVGDAADLARRLAAAAAPAARVGRLAASGADGGDRHHDRGRADRSLELHRSPPKWLMCVLFPLCG